ncbi:MAG: GreA/GreB family elongation factor [Chloroflexi bacterium]|nr:GreA/GreB family elongation factor [Chloroflexota bacterium]
MEKEAYTLSPDAMNKLRAELDQLQTVRLPELVAAIEQARADDPGSIEDNTGFLETQQEYEMVLGHIQRLEYILRHAEVLSPDQVSTNVVRIGSRVTVLDQQGKQQTYHIVDSGEFEWFGSPLEGRVSNDSPVGRSLLGKQQGETVDVAVPDGARKLTIIAISD